MASRYKGPVVLAFGKFFAKAPAVSGATRLSPVRYCGLSDGSDPSHPCDEPGAWFGADGESVSTLGSPGTVGPVFIGGE